MEAKHAGIWVAIIALVILVIAGVWYVGTYNALVNADQSVSQKAADLDSSYQRRFDLIPNLVATVKGAANFEQSTFTKITELRSAWSASADPAERQKIGAEADAEIGRLLLVFENYPQLRATDAYRDLLVQLEGTENRVNFARTEFNASVRAYNSLVRSMPSNIVAKMNGFSEKEFFEATPGAADAPRVNFE